MTSDSPGLDEAAARVLRDPSQTHCSSAFTATHSSAFANALTRLVNHRVPHSLYRADGTAVDDGLGGRSSSTSRRSNASNTLVPITIAPSFSINATGLSGDIAAASAAPIAELLRPNGITETSFRKR